jgi:uncharacterized phosphosugar-binding protein
MNNVKKYYEVINERLRMILDQEMENIEQAAEVISESLKNEDNLLHVFGTGSHSIMAGEEIFSRAGGLVQIDPIFFAGVSLINGRMKAIEHVPGIAPHVMAPHSINEGEVIIISSQAGFNSLTIDAANESKRRGLYVIGIESRELCKLVPKDSMSRHPSGKNLHDIADLTIDAKIPFGDAVINIPGAMQKTAPVSDILIFFILHSIVICTIEKLIEKGANPPIWKSGNIPGGNEANTKYREKYVKLVKSL